MEFILKSIVGGIVIASVVTLSQRGNAMLGALILGLPLTTVISLIFMYYSGVDNEVFVELSKQAIGFIVISLVFFPLFASLVSIYAFWPSLSISMMITMACLYIYRFFS